jgi:hypothetical protein
MLGCSTVPVSFQPTRPIPPSEFSHLAFDAVLKAHVKDGLVDYRAIAQDGRFATYLEQLERVDPRALPTRLDQLAFWINAYNAFAIKGILDGNRLHTWVARWWFFSGKRYRVGGQSLTLYDLERNVLIPQFRDPRIHFALVSGARSSPRLRPEAFTADRLEAQLEESARAFVNDLTRNRFDRETCTAYLSKVFEWFEPEFREHGESLLNYVRRYVEDQDLVADLATQPYRIEFLPFDWRLNAVDRDALP